MNGWRPIHTAPQEPDGDPILLAHFDPREEFPIYAVMASWGTAMPGYIHCASYSGWFVASIPLRDPPRRRGTFFIDGILADELPPTHWMPLCVKKIGADSERLG